MRPLRVIAAILAVTHLSTPVAPTESVPAIADLLDLYERRDYFALRSALDSVTGAGAGGSPEMRFLEGALHHAFNRPDESNRTLTDVLSDEGLAPELRAEALRLRMANHLRLHDYAAAHGQAEKLVAAPVGAPAALVSQVANTAQLLDALRETPPQEVTVGKTSRLSFNVNGHVTARVGDRRVDFALDTGANFSVLMESEARRAGLVVREVGLLVATSTGATVAADVAIADRLELGSASFRNVVFLVVPDSELEFAGGTRIPGLIGFPVLEALGEIRFLSRGAFEIPGKVPARDRSDLALDELELLVDVSFQNEALVCRLDTGASRTSFYEPFHRRFRERFKRTGVARRVEVGGIGGVRELDVVRVPSVTLQVGRLDFELRKVDIYTEPLAGAEHRGLDCNLGRDLLGGARRYYGINFRDMALVIG